MRRRYQRLAAAFRGLNAELEHAWIAVHRPIRDFVSRLEREICPPNDLRDLLRNCESEAGVRESAKLLQFRIFHRTHDKDGIATALRIGGKAVTGDPALGRTAEHNHVALSA